MGAWGKSLSLRSPLSPQVYAPCDKLILASSRKSSALCWTGPPPSAISSHSHTKSLSVAGRRRRARHSARTQVRAGGVGGRGAHTDTIIGEDISARKMQLRVKNKKEGGRMRAIPQAPIIHLTPLPLRCPPQTLIPLKLAYSNNPPPSISPPRCIKREHFCSLVYCC